MNEMFLLKLGEIVLKGGNRFQFENRLKTNIARRMRPFGDFRVSIVQSTAYVEPENADCDLDGAWEACHAIFGVVSLCRCRPCAKDLDAIFDTAMAYLGDDLSMAKSFKVESRRSDKRFPLTSIGLSQEIGGRLAEAFPNVTVDVHHPDYTVYVEVRDRAAYVHGPAEPGAGGLPTGVGGRAMLLLSGGITWEIPTATIGSTAIFLAIFGGHGFDPAYMIPQLLGGGLLMAAFFMATDPVTGPSTTKGQLLYGALTGVLIGLFRVKGSAADSTTYAVLLANLFGNLIDELFIPVPYGFRIPKEFKKAIPKPVIILLVITLIAGAVLSGVYVMTEDQIAMNNEMASQAAYKEVIPDAAKFNNLQVEGGVSGSTEIQKVLEGVDSSDVKGYAIAVHNSQSFDGGLTLVVGIRPDGTVTGISFTELHETAGMGMRCDEPEFKSQFENVNVTAFTLNKGGASTAEDVIDSINGASVSSGAVVDAVNAALSYFAANLK